MKGAGYQDLRSERSQQGPVAAEAIAGGAGPRTNVTGPSAGTWAPPVSRNAAEPSSDSNIETRVGADALTTSKSGDSRRRSDAVVGRNVGMLAGSQIVSWGMAALWTVIVSRALGPAGFGLVVSATAVTGVIGVLLAFGSQTYLARDLVRDPESGPQIVGTAIVLKLALVPITALATILFTYLAHYGHEARLVVFYGCAMTAFTALAVPSQAAFQALEQMRYLAYGTVIGNTAESIVGIVMVLLGLRAEGVMAGMALMAGVTLLLNVWWLRRYIRIDLRTRLSALLAMSRKSSTFLATSVFALIYLWIDTIMVSLMTRSRVVGWYGATTTLFQTLLFLPSIIITAWFPRLVAASAEGREELLRVARAPLELTLVLCIPLATGTAMFAHVAVVAFYGHGFSRATPVMVALAVCIPPMSMNIVLAKVSQAGGQERIWAVLMTVAAFVNPAINLGLITLFQHLEGNGAIGAAWAMVLTEVVLDTVGLLVVGRHVLDGGALKRLALTCLASGGMLLAYHFAAPLGQPVALVAGVLVFFALALKLSVFNQDEMGLVFGLATKLRIRMNPRASMEQAA